jgi:putative peptide zinc metalloprotease protein
VPATGGRALAILAVAGIAGLVIGRDSWLHPEAAGATALATALALFLVSGLVHELGHAAALLRSGYRPGGIGAGLMVILPVLWCDVSAVALLGRRDRLRVDLAGPAFHVAVAGAFAVAAPALPAAGGAAAAGVYAVAWSLLPVIRSDGFWALADGLGAGDLERAPTAADPPRIVRLLLVYGVLRRVFLTAVTTLFLYRVAVLVRGLCA